MAKKMAEKESWIRRISIGRIISIILTLITIFILFSFLGLLAAIFIGPIPTGNIAVIPIEGTITGGSSGYGSISSQEVVEMIKSADEDKKIKAIILEINSGGGSPVGSDEIAAAVKNAEKPTVAVIREVGASGAYWVATAADTIYANRMSITGSISVVGDYLEFAKLLEDYNITYRIFTSGKFKGMGNPFKELTDEEAALFQKNVNKIHDYFVEAVAENRNLPESRVREIATGEIFLGEEALDIGLIDRIGSMEDAVKDIEEEFNITADLAHYTSRRSWQDFFAEIKSSTGFFPEKKVSLQT